MEQKTTMKISKEFKSKLQHYKKLLGAKSLEEVVEKILSIVPANELNKKEVANNVTQNQNALE